MKKIKQRGVKNQRTSKQKGSVHLFKKKEDIQQFQSSETEDYNERVQLRENIYGFRKIMMILMVVIVVVVLMSLVISSNDYNGYEVVEETSVKNASMIDYVVYQDSLLKYSKDGAVYVDEKGEIVWNETFAMKMPTADVSGEYVAIADLNGNDVYVFNKEGKVSSTTMPYKVCDVSVASQGEFAVILEGETENYINLYDKNGDPISEIQTTINKSGYPMDMDISEDGTKLFSSYLYLDGVNAKNGLAAYNFGAVGQNENADRLMGGYQLDDTIVPKVEFLDNDTICAFGDTQFIIYAMKEKPSEKARISFEQEVQSVVFNNEYIGVVLENEETVKEGKEKAPYVLEVYNTNGRKVMSKKVDFHYENVRMNDEEIVFTGGTECRIITLKGVTKFSYSFSKNVVDLVPTGYKKQYIILYDNGSEVIKLKHVSEKEEE